MAIKYGGTSVKEITYNKSDVSRIIFNSKVV